MRIRGKTQGFHAKPRSCHVVAKRRQPHNIVILRNEAKSNEVSEVAWVVWLSSLRYDMTTHLTGLLSKAFLTPDSHDSCLKSGVFISPHSRQNILSGRGKNPQKQQCLGG